jgi:hypothetical protein
VMMRSLLPKGAPLTIRGQHLKMNQPHHHGDDEVGTSRSPVAGGGAHGEWPATASPLFDNSLPAIIGDDERYSTMRKPVVRARVRRGALRKAVLHDRLRAIGRGDKAPARRLKA